MPLRACPRGRTLSSMTKRIVLSMVLASSFLFACDGESALNDDTPEPDNGIGTSPSDPELLLLQVDAPGALPCGVWVDFAGVDASDAHALACSPADAAFFVSGGVTCSDAVRFAAARGGVARRLDYQLSALEANCL